MRRRASQPPTAICTRCGKSIIFDGMLRNPRGVCIPFNSDYSRHLCQDLKMTSEDIDKATINHLEMLVSKLGKGLQHHKISLVVERQKAKLVIEESAVY